MAAKGINLEERMHRIAARSSGGMTRRQLGKLLCLAPFLAYVSVHSQASVTGARSELDLESSDAHLVESFRWAKQQALSYVFDNDPVGPWYEAALPGRHAFCMRDTSHQVEGAQALGLSRYNHNMLRRFAENISASRDWCSYWEIDRLNRPAPIDYKSDTEFWYNLPANYDVLDACFRMYLWTGDRSYVEDPVFLNFYDRTIADYTARWDLSPHNIMKRTSNIDVPPFFRGDPTYEESSTNNLVGVDLLATQYAAFRAYAVIQAIRGNTESAQSSLQTASQIKTLINTAWWNASQGYFYAFFNKQHQFTGRAGSELLYRDATEDGSKTEATLRTLLATIKSEPASAVEAKSHYAEILYRYGKPEAAYEQIMNLTRDGQERREYPEVSYSVIGALVTGLMGIRVESALPIADISAAKFKTVVATLPQLTAATDWVELRSLPIHDGRISVRHQGDRNTVLTNHGKTVMNWHASFAGKFEALLVEGRPVKPPTVSNHFGRVTTSTTVMVQPGQAIQAQARDEV
jgi:hypothetical protein